MCSNDGLLDVLRSLEHSASVFHLSGKNSLQGYKVQLTLTDFLSSAWTATFPLQDVLDSLEAYEPNEEQLLSWLQAAYSTTQPKLIRENGRVAGVEAFHQEGGAHVRLKLPPSSALEEVKGQAAFDQYQRLAALLCEKCETASVRAQESAQQVDRLSSELAAEKERADKLRRKLLELQPGIRLTASGSFKGPQETSHPAQAAADVLDASHTKQSVSPMKASSSSAEGLHFEPGPGSPQSKAPGVGKPKVVRGRGPGRRGGRIPSRGRSDH